jgi:TonB family protein
MKRWLHWALLPGVAAAAAVPARAEWRCDCTAVVDSCRAEVTIQGNWVEVSSDHQQCSRVDYFIDGLPFVAVVVDGMQRQDWIARTEGSQILVQSCQVCRDNAGAPQAPAAAPQTTARQPAPDAALTPLIEVAPQYPAAARAQGIEGYVEISFRVNAQGAVEQPTVTASVPPGVFDQAALAAIGRWRYPPTAQDAAPRPATQRIDFSLGAAGRRATVTDAPIQGGPRNQCLREQAVYNYGDMVEVDLINACADPLLVYSCAAGTGRDAGRWVCASSEESQQILLASDDARIGTFIGVDTPGGIRGFEFTGDFLLARAPNTQYWWVACGQGDAACRDSARQWVRSLDRQSVDANPEARSPLTLGRSF